MIKNKIIRCKIKFFILWLFIIAIIFMIDQTSKLLAIKYLIYNTPYKLIPNFNLLLAINTGAAFSFLHSNVMWHQWLFVIFALLISCGLMIYLYKISSTNNLLSLAISLIIGGALGNAYDRALHGYVIDFCHFYIGSWNFAIFNFADSAITVGVILFIIHNFIKKS